VCAAVEGRFLNEPSVEALRAATERAREDGMGAVFLTDGPLGEALTLASALSAVTSGILLGVRTSLRAHPALLARDMTTFDLVARGRTAVAFMGPHDAATVEAIGLCRGMWRDGIGVNAGPFFPVPGAVNRPRPFTAAGPLVALDLTDGLGAPTEVVAVCDVVLIAAGSPVPDALPPGVDVCQIHTA
jgi:alkanesulfonate monooxygenase SsuD/methylene tetrahydromethanopterin reductase-like flavin-dependent oxidoreductase (luciferase family)